MEFVRIADNKRVDFILAAVRNAAPDGGDILDVGCGNGIISMALGRLGYRVTGVDVSEKTIASAEAQNHLPNVVFKLAGVKDLHDDQKIYDAVICSEVLEHLDHPEELLTVIRGLLGPSGLLVVTVPNGLGPREFFVTRPVQQMKSVRVLWTAIKKMKQMMGYTGVTAQSSADELTHIQFFTLPALRKLAADAGFAVATVKASNWMEQVFPFSLLARKSLFLQRLDCRLADRLPIAFTSGFMTCWRPI